MSSADSERSSRRFIGDDRVRRSRSRCLWLLALLVFVA